MSVLLIAADQIEYVLYLIEVRFIILSRDRHSGAMPVPAKRGPLTSSSARPYLPPPAATD